MWPKNAQSRFPFALFVISVKIESWYSKFATCSVFCTPTPTSHIFNLSKPTFVDLWPDMDVLIT